MTARTSDLPSEILFSFFSYLENSDKLKCREVCQLWNHIVTMDPNWQVLAQALNKRSLSPIDISSPMSCLANIKNFCIRARLHIPQFYSVNKKEMLNNMQAALKLMDTEPLIKYDPSKTSDTSARGDRTFAASHYLRQQLKSALESGCSDQASCVIQWMSMNGASPQLMDLDTALKRCPDSVPAIIDVMKKYNPKVFENFHSDWFLPFAKHCPQHVPLFLEGMKFGHQIPTNQMIYFALDYCPEHIPAILNVLKNNRHRILAIEGLNNHVLGKVIEKCPQYTELIKNLKESEQIHF